ncbi:MAG: LiaI-LiaF-like domain-containing protein [Vicinamibacteria bacterium]
MKRSPAAAVWLSLIPGAGHLYVGQVGKGFLLILLLASVIQIVNHGAEGFGIVIPFIWLYAMLDAHRSAVEINRIQASGGAVPRTADYGLTPSWGYVLIALGVIFTLQNFDLIDFEWLWNLWPLGLIALGAYILRRRPEPPIPSAPPGSELPTYRTEEAAATEEDLAGEEHGNV